MNRPALFILALLMLSLTAICQDGQTDKKETDKEPSYKYKRTEFGLTPLKNKETLAFPVHMIEVADVRQDTTKFGYYGKGNIISPFRQFCFENNAVTIASFFNGSFNLGSPRAGEKLLYCIKKLWIANADTSYKQTINPEIIRSKVYLQAELFFEKDSTCYPLYRFDSVFIYMKEVNSSSVKWIEDALVSSLQRLKGLLPEKVIKRSSLPGKDINEYYANEKRVPVNSVTAPVKGVYLNVTEFKNNRPSFAGYELSLDKTVDIMRVKEADGNYNLIRNDWGYCDGKNFFIRFGQNYFQLFRTGDTYELYGSSQFNLAPRRSTTGPMFTDPYTGLPTGGSVPAFPLKDPEHLGRIRPLQLDMETGRVY